MKAVSSRSWAVSVDRVACVGVGRACGAGSAGDDLDAFKSRSNPCLQLWSPPPSGCSTALSVNTASPELNVIIVNDDERTTAERSPTGWPVANAGVRVIHHANNAGHIATYNEGLSEAQGDYVVLLSADDVLTPGSLERATGLLEAHRSVGLVYGHALRFSGSPPLARTQPTGWLIWSGRDWITTRFEPWPQLHLLARGRYADQRPCGKSAVTGRICRRQRIWTCGRGPHR